MNILRDETAGISCQMCGFKKVVTSKVASEHLKKTLKWSTGGDPICPNCNHLLTYEEYIT